MIYMVQYCQIAEAIASKMTGLSNVDASEKTEPIIPQALPPLQGYPTQFFGASVSLLLFILDVERISRAYPAATWGQYD